MKFMRGVFWLLEQHKKQASAAKRKAKADAKAAAAEHVESPTVVLLQKRLQLSEGSPGVANMTGPHRRLSRLRGPEPMESIAARGALPF